MLETISSYVLDNVANAYLAVFLLLLLCGFGVPIPEDIILITGGTLAAAASHHFLPMVLVSFAGVMIGDSVVYCIGRFGNQRVRKLWPFSKVFQSKMSEKIEYNFQKRGEFIIFVGRFLPGLRMPIFVSAGFYRIKFRTFILYDGTAALISVPLFVWLGFVFAENLDRLYEIIKTSKHGAIIVIGAVAALVALVFITKKLKKRFVV